MNSNQFSSIDFIVLIVYFIGIAAYGSYFMKKNKTAETFTAAGRSLPGWAVGLSILGTYVSSISFLALPGKSYAADWNPFVFSLSLPLATWMAVRFFVPLYREHGDISAYSYLEKRFGPWARIYASLCYLLTQLARMGSIMFLLALAFHELLGWNIITIIIITGVIVTIYTWLGGIEAVIWTDVVQSFVLIAGALACSAILFFNMPEGPGQIFTIAHAHNKFSLGSLGLSFSSATFWVVLLYGTAINLQNFGIDQTYVQRFLTAKTSREAKKSVLIGALSYIPLSALFIFIGTELFAYYTAQPHLLPDTFKSTQVTDKVFPYFIVTGLPKGIVGLVISAIFAAAMSTISSSINSASTLILTDFYKRFAREKPTEKKSLQVLRISTLCWGLAGTGMALAMIGVSSVLDAWWKLAGIFGGGMLGLFLLGYFARKAGNMAAALSTSLGILVILWMTFSPGKNIHWASPFHSFLIPVIGTLAIFLAGILLSHIKFLKRLLK
ncbi:MAG: sodium:solute symporter [Acidobacteria bacterium]|jgi:SSS family solute:Na+ symporter|nr:sodium:solute symporter [Acidobacteriota bacterium]